MWRIDLSGTASAARVIPQTPSLAQQCDDQQRPGGIADFGGLMVIIALIGMLVGVLRYSGTLDPSGDVR